MNNIYQVLLDYLDHVKNVKLDRHLTLKVASTAVLGFVVIYMGKIWRSYSFFKKRKIQTPPYRFFYGNLPEIMKKGFSPILNEWTNKYGKTFGYYEGHLPVLVTSDIEIVEEIFFKQMTNFTGRRLLPIQASDTDERTNVFSSSKTRWKRLRTIINPIFSPSKLKEFFHPMKICSDRLLTVIEANQDRQINLMTYLDRMTMDAVWKSIFGMDVDIQNNPNMSYFVKTKTVAEGFSNFSPFFRLATYFYELKFILLPLFGFYTFFASKISDQLGMPVFWLIQQAQVILDETVKNSKKNHDYVTLLLDAESDDLDKDLDKQQYDHNTLKFIKKKMSHNEVKVNLLGFLFAGFDTTASTLGFCFYVLINNPDEVVKIQDDIDSIDDFTYESLQKLEYLDCFVKEVMRMYPVANSIITRRCTQATTIKGIDIPENLLIVVNVLNLHYDPKYWGDVDPNVFYPPRFSDMSKINKLAYLPFGGGSRTCLGMKFALMEIKLTLAKILSKYDVFPASPNPKDIVIRDGTFTIRRPKYGLDVIFRKRQ